MKPETIMIDDVKYVRAEAVKEVNNDNYVIIRTYSAGVFAGTLVSRKDREVKLSNARRLWHWKGAASLSQLAMEGVSKPDECKFPCEVTEITLLDALEVILCTDMAIKSIKSVKVWSA